MPKVGHRDKPTEESATHNLLEWCLGMPEDALAPIFLLDPSNPLAEWVYGVREYAATLLSVRNEKRNYPASSPLQKVAKKVTPRHG